MSIKLSELLQNHTLDSVPNPAQVNLAILLPRMNQVRELWGKPMMVTSGFRSMADHIRIYKELAAKRKQPYDQAKVPMGSKHLSGSAVDIADPDGKLFVWCKANEKTLESIGLWCEEKDDQKRVHFQCCPYGSWKPGKTIFFKP